MAARRQGDAPPAPIPPFATVQEPSGSQATSRASVAAEALIGGETYPARAALARMRDRSRHPRSRSIATRVAVLFVPESPEIVQ
jgi:hypothetical protein